jgi:hypothetical protein
MNSQQYTTSAVTYNYYDPETPPLLETMRYRLDEGPDAFGAAISWPIGILHITRVRAAW